MPSEGFPYDDHKDSKLYQFELGEPFLEYAVGGHCVVWSEDHDASFWLQPHEVCSLGPLRNFYYLSLLALVVEWPMSVSTDISVPYGPLEWIPEASFFYKPHHFTPNQKKS